jgi:ssDNA-binding Zn-finger/Zn-ribbon topoisomerase 1
MEDTKEKEKRSVPLLIETTCPECGGKLVLKWGRIGCSSCPYYDSSESF